MPHLTPRWPDGLPISTEPARCVASRVAEQGEQSLMKNFHEKRGVAALSLTLSLNREGFPRFFVRLDNQNSATISAWREIADF